MHDVTQATVRRLGFVAAVLLMSLVASGATAARASAEEICASPGPLVCVKVVGSSSTVSPSTALFPTFVSYSVTVTNRSASTVTHLALSDVTGGSTLVSVAPRDGTCTSNAGVVDCVFGSLPSQGRVDRTILVQTPLVAGQLSNAATATFDEGRNDSPTPDPKQDTVAASVVTPAALAGTAASLVPSNAEVRIDTDPTHKDVATPQDPNIGKARVPASPHDAITATLNEEPGPVSCPTKVICRGGDWLHANIGDGRKFSPALEFELHWSKVLVPKQQTVKNLAVLHTGDCAVTCPVVPDVITRRCSSADPPLIELPCLTDVVETASEFRATLHSETNGRMR